jgi:hypothetical protein
MQNVAPPASTGLGNETAHIATDVHEKGREGSSKHNARDSFCDREHAEKELENREEITSVPESDNAAAELENEANYLSGVKLGILTLGLCLTTFVIALDNTIIATAIPRITTVFDSLGDVGWYGSSYLLTTTSLQPSFGKIYTYFDVKFTYLFALIIFEVGSIICAAATSSPMFIVGRAVAGAGAAALFSGGMNIIGYSVPLQKRPILGGVLTDQAR